MGTGTEAGSSTEPRRHDDVLFRLRTGTAAEHEAVERMLDLLDPGIGRGGLIDVLSRLHAFWLAAEAGLDDWAHRRPRDAERLSWPRRRRAALYAADVAALGGTAGSVELPRLSGGADTDAALGRLYVLEGSTLGGTFIDRHLSGVPGLAGVRLGAFSPYGPETGAMWAGFRRATRDHVAAGGDPDRIVAAAQETFAALATWANALPQPRAVSA